MIAAVPYRLLRAAADFFAQAAEHWRPTDVALIWTDDSDEPLHVLADDTFEVNRHTCRACARGARVEAIEVVSLPAWRAREVVEPQPEA